MEPQKSDIASSVRWHQEIKEVQMELIGETGNHVKRVAEYSYILAPDLGLSDEEADWIRKASPLHDIGKIAIPENILTKPGKLTPEEYAVMKWHAHIGYSQLKGAPCKMLQAGAVIAHEHHEKWNGQGYPRGLKGEEIHLYGRITAIADVFDALFSSRVYKKPWELDRVLRLLSEERGEHFDPNVVDVFMDRLPEILRIHEQYREDNVS